MVKFEYQPWKKIIEKQPKIKAGFLAYTYGMSDFFDGLDWKVGLIHSHSEEKEGFSPFASAKIKISSSKIVTAREEREIESIEFIISPNDLDSMIKSLQKLKEALTKITNVKESE